MTIPGDEHPPAVPHRQGRLHAWRARWFGERDEVADQLADIARQGSGMARLAHMCASLMLVLFSAGSLVALGGDALLSVLNGALGLAAGLHQALMDGSLPGWARRRGRIGAERMQHGGGDGLYLV